MPRPRLLFLSYHCFADPASGAALATRDQFGLLAARGWPCRVLTGPLLDDAYARPVGERLRRVPGATVAPGRVGPVSFAVHSLPGPGYPAAVFEPTPPPAPRLPTAAEAEAFAAVAERAVAGYRPDVVLTYGGDLATRAGVAAARRAGAKVAFRLHNFAYPDRAAIPDCDAVVANSEYTARHYRQAVGLDPLTPPYLLDPRRVIAPDPAPRFVTFVNPEPAKGLYPFARLAEVLGRERPDVLLLVVEGRGKLNWLAGCGVDPRALAGVRGMPNTPDPRAFYRVSKVVVVPSVWRESFGRVAAEALLNGIPVVASDRGALPETVGGGGVCLPLPGWLTPESRTPPTAEEVRPWIDAVLRLWNDPAAYAAAAAAARERAKTWDPEATVPAWEDFLTRAAGR